MSEHARRARPGGDLRRALRHQWFPVARAVDLDRPVEATLLGERLVVFRTASGRAARAAARAAPPRRQPGQGRGARRRAGLPVPRLAVRRRGRSLRARPVARPGGRQAHPATPRASRPTPRPSTGATSGRASTSRSAGCPSRPSSPTSTSASGSRARRCTPPSGWPPTTENFRDVAHFPFVHRGTMGEVPHVVEPLDVRRDGLEVWMDREVRAHDEASIWSDDGDAAMRYHTIAPGVSIILYDVRARRASRAVRRRRRRPGPSSARSSGAWPTTRRSRA